MKKIFYILIFFLISCKSTESTKNNQLDISETKTEISKNTVQISQLDLDTKEITFIVADPKEETVFIDEKGKKQTFKNVASVKISNKKEIKKDSIVADEKKISEKLVDKSKISETSESVSDSKNFKGIFCYGALIVICITIVFLIIRFKIKAKKDITV